MWFLFVPDCKFFSFFSSLYWKTNCFYLLLVRYCSYWNWVTVFYYFWNQLFVSFQILGNCIGVMYSVLLFVHIEFWNNFAGFTWSHLRFLKLHFPTLALVEVKVTSKLEFFNVHMTICHKSNWLANHSHLYLTLASINKFKIHQHVMFLKHQMMSTWLGLHQFDYPSKFCFETFNSRFQSKNIWL